jgi:hypothetical protein
MILRLHGLQDRQRAAALAADLGDDAVNCGQVELG